VSILATARDLVAHGIVKPPKVTKKS
jgi:hypothetical protein